MFTDMKTPPTRNVCRICKAPADIKTQSSPDGSATFVLGVSGLVCGHATSDVLCLTTVPGED